MRSWIKSLWKDSLVYGIGYGVSRFLQVIILPIIAGALTLSEFGYYSNYVIFYSVMGGLMILGLDSAVARYFYDSDDKKYHQQLFSTAFLFILAFSTGSVVILSFFREGILQVLGIPQLYGAALPYVLLCVPVVALNGFFLSWFKWKRQKFLFLVNSGGSVVLLLLPLLLAPAVDFIYIFRVLFWSQGVIAACSVLLASSYIRPYFQYSLMKSLLAYGFPWMLVFIFGVSRTYLDRAFLMQYLSDDVYGLYNFSVRISTLISVLITAFDMSFGPLAFSIWNKEGAPAFFARLQSLYIFLMASVACAICICSPVIVRLLGGEKYEGAEKVLPVLLFAAIPLSLINFSNLGTVYAKKSFLSTVSLFVGFAAVLLLNFLFTRTYLQYGATSASLVGHLLIIATGYFLSNRYYKIPFSYVKDACVFLFFFFLSLVVVQVPVSTQLYYNMLIQFSALCVIMVVLLVFFFPREYRVVMTAVKGLGPVRPAGQ